MENVSKRFSSVLALDKVNLQVRKAQVVVIVGPSGSGKSTLLRCINGLELVDSGTVQINGQYIDSHNQTSIYTAREHTGMVFQQFNLFPHIKVIDNITLALRKVKKIPKKQAEEIAIPLLKKVFLLDKKNVYPNELSGGQKQRVAIARALAVNPSIMLFDEPTSALDPEMIKEVLDVMNDLAEKDNMTMVIVSHEMGFARSIANLAVFMDQGKIIESGNPEIVLYNPQKERTKKFLEHII
ncbi:hypothetical protein LSH36_583g02012 [Paralvinella palmiformis]|uniref:ABC transporter domain-containing protein n=1 Tax=Paralvinella palmiformis TaxID=53620 RepID=A0AAD9MWK8_9ANNE|nr:hypothetical protein LSH36_583g02012 [Paralvinella palmiformis]